MGSIPWILGVILLVSCEGKPQIADNAPVDTAAVGPNPLVSPWSQWMSLKAPPIPGLPLGGKKAKKKLVPGPPPPEGTPEAPWVSWTRMKVASALSPPPTLSSVGAPLAPLSPPPSPIDSDDNDTSSSGEPTVWIQWTQMKLPLSQLSAPAAPESSPGPVKRMAPDRYAIASTISPRLTSWPPSPSSPQPVSQSSSAQFPSQAGSAYSARPTYLDVLNATPSRYVPSNSSPAAPASSSLSPGQPKTSPETLPVALRPIPHQLVSQIVAKATPQELTQVILAVSKAEEQADSSSPPVTVQQVLPSTLLAKLPDDLTPLLDIPIKSPSTTPKITSSTLSTDVGPLTLIPQETRTVVVSKATPDELGAVVTTLAKLEAIPPSEQAPLASIPVSAILPPSLQAKIPPSVVSTKLVPPVLLSFPAPVIDAALPVATPAEIDVIVANAAKLKKMPSLAPRPPLDALLPPSLIAKLPSQLTPLLAKPVPAAPLAPPKVVTPTTSPITKLSALPSPLVPAILTTATPPEIQTITDALSVLEAAIPVAAISVSPPTFLVVPSSLVPKLPPQLVPLLSEPLSLPPPETDGVAAVLQAIPPPLLQQIIAAAAVPEELAEIKKNVEAKETAIPVPTPIVSLLPVSMVAKLPPQFLPSLNQVVTIPPKATPPAAVASTLLKPEALSIPGVPSPKIELVAKALSKLPALVVTKILTEATPTEISEVADVISKLEALPPAEKPLIEQLPVENILPPALLAKLPAAILPALKTPVVLPETTSAPLEVPGVPPTVVATVAPVLAALPEPIVKEILTVATPMELAQVVDTITRLEALPPTQVPILSTLEVASILPDSLVAKLPKPVIPFLAASITIPPVAAPAVLPLTAAPVIPNVPPAIVQTVATALSAVPPPVVNTILTTATPSELAAVADTLKKLEALSPTEAAIAAKLEVATILPPTLLAKVPASVLPLLSVPVTIPPEEPAVPIVPGVPPKTVEIVAAALSSVPLPVINEIIKLATPTELAEVAEIVAKIEELSPIEAPLAAKLEVATILPATLIAKIPPSNVPLLSVPVTISTPEVPTVTTSVPVVPGVPPKTVETVAAALSTVPTPVVNEIIKLATPTELAEVAEIVAKLEDLSPVEAPLAAKLEVATILPPTLLAKIPASVLPLLSVPVTIPPPEEPAVPIVPGVPPKTVETVAAALSTVPTSVVNEIIKLATPAELAEVAEIVAKLEDLSPLEAPLAAKLEVATILPATLIAKIQPSIVPLLSVPVTIPTPEKPTAAVPLVPGVPPKRVETVAAALSSVPPPIVNEIIKLATPTELAEVAEIVAKLKDLSPAEAPLAATLEAATILPATLVAKIPPSIVPLLSVPVTIPAPTIPTVPGVPPAIVSTIAPVLSAVPKPVINEILSVATPAELTEIADIITKLETLPPAEKPLAAILAVETILPPTLLAKLPPTVIPLLSTPITLPENVAPVVTPVTPSPEEPTTPLVIPGLPPSIASIAVPPLSALPPPAIESILTTATPSELAQLVDTLLKLEALAPAEKQEAAVLEVGTVLPPSLVEKLPALMVPLLSTPIKISGVVPLSAAVATPASPEPVPLSPIVPPGVPPLIQSTILPALVALPPQVTNDILTIASPAELMEIADTIAKLDSVPPAELPPIAVESVIPPPLLARLPPTITPVLAVTPLKTSSPATPAPMAPVKTSLPAVDTDEPLLPAEEKVLTKWAKIILEKTGKPATSPVPGEIPPLQAAWMEWIELKVNASNSPTTTPASPGAEQATTEYPWTQWLKLKTNSTEETTAALSPTAPLLDVTTEGPEKVVLDWLKELETETEKPTESTPVVVSPETEEMVAEALKELGIEIVDLPPEQVKSILEQVEKTVNPATIPGVAPPVVSDVVPPPLAPGVLSPYLPYLPYIPPKPALRFWPRPLPAPAPPTLPLTPIAIPTSLAPSPPAPTLNLTEYLISNSLIPPDTPPSASIPIPTLSKLITEQALLSSETSTPESTITADELGSLTPTKFAALLKQILQDCRVNSTIPTNSSSLAVRSVYPNPYATYYKKKYSSWRGKRSPALYPIPSQAFTPTSTPHPLDTASIPLPKVDTSGTVLDPAYWAAQKSMFLSKLFSTLAKVALNDTNNQGTTPSPKDQLTKQVNTVLLSDMTRSVRHHTPKKQPVQVVQEEEEEDSTEAEDEYQEEDDTDTQESQGSSNHDLNKKEKELVSNDDSEPDLPKEPENPLHKLFKFGVQKTVLSDLTTPPPAPAPIYIYVTPPSYYPEAFATPPPPPSSSVDHSKKVHPKKKKSKAKKKKLPSSSSSHHNTQNHHHQKSQSSRFRQSGPSTSTTTESPVDFELLAKALLLDDTGNGPKATGGRK